MTTACFLVGLVLLVKEVVFGEARLVILLLATSMIGMPAGLAGVDVGKPGDRPSPLRFLTPLDRAWLRYHHDHLGRDA